MRVLLAECLPRKLKSELTEHEVRTGQEQGWAGLKNGALLQVASGHFDVLLKLTAISRSRKTSRVYASRWLLSSQNDGSSPPGAAEGEARRGHAGWWQTTA